MSMVYCKASNRSLGLTAIPRLIACCFEVEVMPCSLEVSITLPWRESVFDGAGKVMGIENFGMRNFLRLEGPCFFSQAGVANRRRHFPLTQDRQQELHIRHPDTVSRTVGFLQNGSFHLNTTFLHLASQLARSLASSYTQKRTAR
jgi:hypothetical protein